LDATGSQESFIRLVAALPLFWELRGHLKEGGRWFARALAAEGPASRIRARALWGATHVAMYGDDFATAARRGPEALAMAEDVGEASVRARAWNAVRRGELRPARMALAASLELCREVGEPVTAGVAVAAMGEADLLAGEYDQAAGRLNAFLPRASATGGATGVPIALTVLASV